MKHKITFWCYVAIAIFCITMLAVTAKGTDAVVSDDDVTIPTPVQKYKKAPYPRYTEEKGFGWATNVPVDKPENVWNVLKKWKTREVWSLFVDKDKDGKCDTVYEFFKIGKHTSDEDSIVRRLPNRDCVEKQKEIINVIRTRVILDRHKKRTFKGVK